MKSHHRAELFSHFRRQGFIGEDHIGPQGVASKLRRLLGVEAGYIGWALEKAEVGVPTTAKYEPALLIGLLDDFDDLGMVFHCLDEGCRMGFAKEAGELALLIGRHGLISKEDHQMFVEGHLNRFKRCVREGFGNIDTFDLCADGPGNRHDVNRGIRHGED